MKPAGAVSTNGAMSSSGDDEPPAKRTKVECHEETGVFVKLEKEERRSKNIADNVAHLQRMY